MPASFESGSDDIALHAFTQVICDQFRANSALPQNALGTLENGLHNLALQLTNQDPIAVGDLLFDTLSLLPRKHEGWVAAGVPNQNLFASNWRTSVLLISGCAAIDEQTAGRFCERVNRSDFVHTLEPLDAKAAVSHALERSTDYSGGRLCIITTLVRVVEASDLHSVLEKRFAKLLAGPNNEWSYLGQAKFGDLLNALQTSIDPTSDQYAAVGYLRQKLEAALRPGRLVAAIFLRATQTLNAEIMEELVGPGSLTEQLAVFDPKLALRLSAQLRWRFWTTKK